MVATNSIRGGKNRAVLDAIVRDSRIYDAWSDEPWVNDGAAVRVSLVAFGNPSFAAMLNGQEVKHIGSDLVAQDSPESMDMTSASRLAECANTSFMGITKSGPFDVPGRIARDMLRQPNPHGRSNAEVLRPTINGADLAKRPTGEWILDFGLRSEPEAMLFEVPYSYARQTVFPARQKSRTPRNREIWWRFERPRPEMFEAFGTQQRYIATCLVAKHRFFVWTHRSVVPENVVIVIARADDTSFGILHSRFHELWSLRMGSSLEDRPRYTPTTCFETFPFPAGLTPLDTAHQRTEALAGGALIPAGLPDALAVPALALAGVSGLSSESNQPPVAGDIDLVATVKIAVRDAASAIAQAAQRLDTLRQNWLNPPEWTVKVPEVVPLGLSASPYPDRIEPRPGLSEADARALQKRTLTNLYNQRPAWLVQAHAALDAAVAAAYGWTDYSAAMPDDDILRRLLALNHARAGEGAP